MDLHAQVGCQIRRLLKAGEIAARRNIFKSLIRSVALGNFEIFSRLMNKCLPVVIPSIYNDYTSSFIYSVSCICVSTLRASSTGEAVLESGFVCNRQYRTLPSHETELRVCCPWQQMALQLLLRFHQGKLNRLKGVNRSVRPPVCG